MRISARKYKIKKKSDDIHWNVWTNIKTLYAQNNIFKKRISNTRFLNQPPSPLTIKKLPTAVIISLKFKSFYFIHIQININLIKFASFYSIILY